MKKITLEIEVEEGWSPVKGMRYSSRRASVRIKFPDQPDQESDIVRVEEFVTDRELVSVQGGVVDFLQYRWNIRLLRAFDKIIKTYLK